MTNNLIVKQQFGFLPGKSKHQVVFKVLKHMYGSLNNNIKVIGTVFLDVAKSFNCIDQELLFEPFFLIMFLSGSGVILLGIK